MKLVHLAINSGTQCNNIWDIHEIICAVIKDSHATSTAQLPGLTSKSTALPAAT